MSLTDFSDSVGASGVKASAPALNRGKESTASQNLTDDQVLAFLDDTPKSPPKPTLGQPKTPGGTRTDDEWYYSIGVSAHQHHVQRGASVAG
jgi:hypothetical protein